MEKIFYTDKAAYPHSISAVSRILSEYFNIQNPTFVKNEHGKPYLVGCEVPLFFSVTHTKERLFIAVSDENVGLDAESLSRQRDYTSIIKRFARGEQAEIRSTQDFLRHWVAKESAVKWLGGSLAKDLYKLRFEKERLYYGEIEIPAYLCFHSFENHILAVCGERDFSNAEFLKL